MGTPTPGEPGRKTGARNAHMTGGPDAHNTGDQSARNAHMDGRIAIYVRVRNQDGGRSCISANSDTGELVVQKMTHLGAYEIVRPMAFYALAASVALMPLVLHLAKKSEQQSNVSLM